MSNCPRRLGNRRVSSIICHRSKYLRITPNIIQTPSGRLYAEAVTHRVWQELLRCKILSISGRWSTQRMPSHTPPTDSYPTSHYLLTFVISRIYRASKVSSLSRCPPAPAASCSRYLAAPSFLSITRFSFPRPCTTTRRRDSPAAMHAVLLGQTRHMESFGEALPRVARTGLRTGKASSAIDLWP